MRIGIDIRTLNPQSPTGIGKYIYSLLQHFVQLDGENTYDVYYPFRSNSSSWIRKNLGDSFAAHMGWVPEFLSAEKFNDLWLRRYLPARIKKDRIDVFHGPSYLLPEEGNVKRIVTIHDLSPVLFPSMYEGITSNAIVRRTKNAVEQADAVIADSEHTRRDIIELYHTPPDKVRTIYLGIDERYSGPVEEGYVQEVREKYDLPEDFILHVGSYHPRKNTEVILRALSNLRKRGKVVRLVLSGKKTRYFSRIQELVRDLQLEKFVKFMGYIPDEQVHALYSCAKALVYPSLYEGFCLPMIEAMASGLPCIVANTACLPEVAGEAVILVDPNSPENIADAIIRVLENHEVREELSKAGYERSKKFSWKKAASETLDLYKEVAGY